MTRVRQLSPRRGVSALELLIVSAIIMILVGLTAGAVLRYTDVQHERNTRLTLQKLDRLYNQQRSAALEAADKEKIPDPIRATAGNDQAARILYKMYCLQREFPMSLAEAQNPGPGMQPVPSFQSLQGKGLSPDKESAALMYISLGLNRSGTRVNLDTALSTREVLTDAQTGVKYLADDWGYPIQFYRWPTDNPQFNPGNINASNPQALLTLDAVFVSPGRNGRLGLDLKTAASDGSSASFDNVDSLSLRQR